MPSHVETAFYEPSPRDHIRILIEYKGEWKPLFWFSVGKDGSIYLSPRNKKIVKRGTSIAKEGMVSVDYSEGEVIQNIDSKKNFKTSFHSSGIINSVDNRVYREPLREIKEQQELCTILFQHPDKYESIEMNKLKKRDICLRFPIEEQNPFMARISVAPSDKTQNIIYEYAIYQVDLVLPFSNLTNCQDITIQISIHSVVGDGSWPPYTYLLYPTRDKI